MGEQGKRQRGRVEQLPSRSLRVSVYAGQDPVAKRRHYPREVVPAGPKAGREAQRVLRRLVGQVDDQQSPRTAAIVDQMLDKYTVETTRARARQYDATSWTARPDRLSKRLSIIVK